jgi:type II secretory pathway pseudopilin PulG
VKLRDRQRGVVFVLIVLTVLGILGTILLVGIAGSTGLIEARNVRAANADAELSRYREALIGYLVSPPDPNVRPGALPQPNALIGVGSSYNGIESTKCIDITAPAALPLTGAVAASLNKRCLGKIPWKTMGLALQSVEPHDPTGVVPWMAISANLVWYDSCLKVLNSEIAKIPTSSTPTCPSTSKSYQLPPTLPHRWLTVRNAEGTVMADNVALVVILPGAPIQTETRLQNRSNTSPGTHIDYLDSIRLPLGCVTTCVTYDNASLSNEFVQIKAGTLYPANAEDVSRRGTPIQFNDVLIYLTIDEVLQYVEQRVLAEMAQAVRVFQKNVGSNQLPWAVQLNAPQLQKGFYSKHGETFGHFPFYATNGVDDIDETKVPTEFSWNFPTLSNPTSSCVKVASSPDLYLNRLQDIVGETKSLGTTNYVDSRSVAPTCTWASAGAKNPTCSFIGSRTILSKTYDLYATSACTGLPVDTGSFPVTETVNVDVDMICKSPSSPPSPAPEYLGSTASAPASYSLTCDGMKAFSSFKVDVTRIIDTSSLAATPGLVTSNKLLESPSNGNVKVSISNALYQPVMPSWYAEQGWYRSGFLSIAPQAAPTPSAACAATSGRLVIDNITGVDAAVILAGRTLAINSPLRPSVSLNSYFEGSTNTSVNTNCIFATSSPANSTNNDRVFVVRP